MKEYDLDYRQIVRKVYKEPGASAFMASLAPFILRYKDDEYIGDMVRRCLDAFIRRSLARYGTSQVGVVGSFGCTCREMLCSIGKDYGMEFVKFTDSPIDGLVKYHMYGI